MWTIFLLPVLFTSENNWSYSSWILIHYDESRFILTNHYLNLPALFTWGKTVHEGISILITYNIRHLQVHVQPVLSILLATFAGFGVVMSGSSILVEFFRWRRRWQASSEQQHGPLPITQAGQHPQTVNTPRSDQSNHSHAVVQDLQNSNQSWVDIFVLLMTKLAVAVVDFYSGFGRTCWIWFFCSQRIPHSRIRDINSHLIRSKKCIS
jgi:hypothetical protein